jgi:hypothetical protein
MSLCPCLGFGLCCSVKRCNVSAQELRTLFMAEVLPYNGVFDIVFLTMYNSFVITDIRLSQGSKKRAKQRSNDLESGINLEGGGWLAVGVGPDGKPIHIHWRPGEIRRYFCSAVAQARWVQRAG